MELTHIRDNSISLGDFSIKNYEMHVEAALPDVIALDIHLIDKCLHCKEQVNIGHISSLVLIIVYRL